MAENGKDLVDVLSKVLSTAEYTQLWAPKPAKF